MDIDRVPDAPVMPAPASPPRPPAVITERVRERIRSWIATTGVRQVVLAEQIDKNQAWLSRYLAGEVDADLVTLERLAAAFGHTMLALLDVPAEPTEAYVIDMFRAVAPAVRRDIVRILEHLSHRAGTPRRRRPK